jgi:hypothetical protein
MVRSCGLVLLFVVIDFVEELQGAFGVPFVLPDCKSDSHFLLVCL